MFAPVRTARALLEWPVRTQQGSRRNALVASTALAARRRERLDVEQFLETLAARRGPQEAAGTATRRVI
jgi:hypothetical protein